MIQEEIRTKFNQARKEQNQVAKSTYESVLAKIMNAEKSGKYTLPLEESIIVGLIQKEVKELEETRSFYKESDSAYSELTEKIHLLAGYFPKELTEEEVRAVIREILTEIPNKNFGLAMKETIKRVGNQYDKSKLKDLVMGEING